jgi:hypothetical protein
MPAVDALSFPAYPSHEHAPVLAAGKFGALFASIPNAMVAGLFCVMFSLISGVSRCSASALYSIGSQLA